MAKIGQPMIYKTLHGKLKIEQHNPIEQVFRFKCKSLLTVFRIILIVVLRFIYLKEIYCTWVQSLSFIYIGQPPNTVVTTPTIAPIIQTPQVVNTGNNVYL
jgi:hypothetical protein